MGSTRWKTFIGVIIALPSAAMAQVPVNDSSYIRVNDIAPRIYQRNDTVWIKSGICKTLKVVMLTGQVKSLGNHVSINKATKALLASGDISYQYFQRNGAPNDLQILNSKSDIASLRLNVVYKETYPVSLFVRYNQSSPFQTDNQYEVNLSFDDRSYKELIRDKISGSVKNNFLLKQALILNNYERAFKQFQEQKEILQSPAYTERMVQNRFQSPTMTNEFSGYTPQGVNPIAIANNRITGLSNFSNPIGRLQSIRGNIPTAGIIERRLKDSLASKFNNVQEDVHLELEQRRDSLERLMKKYEDSLSIYKDKYQQELDSLNKELSVLTTGKELKKYADEKGIKDSIRKDRFGDILTKTNLRFGKFILNNSELTVNNIFLRGISVRYGEEKFVQISTGFYDFAFREMFSFRNDSTKAGKKSVFSIKLGKTDGKNLSAINFYVGKKEKSGSANEELKTVSGVSIERNFFVNKNLSLDFELAKSTARLNSLNDKQESTFKDLFGSYTSKTIGVYSSLKAYLPKTNTDGQICYRYWGQQFESFNASQYFNPQNNISAKISQPIFKRKLYINTGIKYSDFKSYGIANNIQSKTLFASATATLRIKKIPILSIGYYPGSQLYLVEGNKLYEYFYYILNTTVSHYFPVKKTPVQTVLTYNKFFNKYADSVVSGSQSYFNFFCTMWSGKFSYQANYSHQKTAFNNLSTVESGITYGTSKLKLGGILKWNFSSNFKRLGYATNMGLSFGKIGTINFIYDKSFLPDQSGKFIPITTGQLQIIKPLKFRL